MTRETFYTGFFLFQLAFGGVIAADRTAVWHLPVGILMMAYSAGYVAWQIQRSPVHGRKE